MQPAQHVRHIQVGTGHVGDREQRVLHFFRLFEPSHGFAQTSLFKRIADARAHQFRQAVPDLHVGQAAIVARQQHRADERIVPGKRDRELPTIGRSREVLGIGYRHLDQNILLGVE
ncbi:MAG TPA: hypothetical protein VKM00_01910, partial [Luteimonas sp.]|nr:hypothetical protein [Luteimonas sp.]